MSTWKFPFPGKDVPEVLRAIYEGTLVPVEQLNPKAPAELIRITKKLLQKDRSQRYQTAADMRRDLQALRSRLGARAGRRRVRLVSASAVVLFALLVFGSLQFPRVREWMPGSPSTSGDARSSPRCPAAGELTGDPSQEYFVDGMTEALITNLTKLGSLRVISRTSAMHYKGTQKTIPEIARELNVNAVLEGSVVRSGNRVRISAQLADAGNGQNLWGRDYEQDLQDVLQLQNEMATAVATEIAGKLIPQDQKRLSTTR
jgi:TolB-like protein